MNVILVDDEEVALLALKRRVDWARYGVEQVFTAANLPEAQAVFRAHPVDIMLSDVEMPQGSGLDLFEWVKLHYPTVECVYVTCHPEFEYMRKALQLGSADYILKPIDYEELDGVLRGLTERLRRRQTAERVPKEVLEKLSEGDRGRSETDPVQTVKRYIRDHLQENIRLADLAGQVYLNEQYLTRLFKKTTGMGILEYITEERLRLARELLRGTDYPINRVSDAVGYDNYSYFARIFKRSTGMTPQAYRQQNAPLSK